jgi:hypothetical protein
VVVDGAVVEAGTAVVDGVQLFGVASEADVVESTVRSGLRIVRVTVPLAGAGPVASQIWVVPVLAVVSWWASTMPVVSGIVVATSTKKSALTLLSSVTDADQA